MEQTQQFCSTNKSNCLKILKVAVLIVVIFFLLKMFGLGYFENKNKQENTISFTGHGEVYTTPDIASVSFSIKKEAKTVKEAQNGVAEVEKKVLEFLKTSKIDNKDIKTVNASFNPKYEYRTESVVCPGGYCPQNGKNILVGYEAYENLTVKIRNTDDAGKIIQGLGELGVSELNGPNFSVDKEDDLKAQARKMAIDDAKAKAKVLAKDLGVKLGKISAFNESGNYPRPMYENVMMKGADMSATSAAPAQLPKGENLISSDVTITYEIR